MTAAVGTQSSQGHARFAYFRRFTTPDQHERPDLGHKVGPGDHHFGAAASGRFFFSSGERCSLDQPSTLDVHGLIKPILGQKLLETPRSLPEGPSFLVP
jgi:hypothetical protein